MVSSAEIQSSRVPGTENRRARGPSAFVDEGLSGFGAGLLKRRGPAFPAFAMFTRPTGVTFDAGRGPDFQTAVFLDHVAGFGADDRGHRRPQLASAMAQALAHTAAGAAQTKALRPRNPKNPTISGCDGGEAA